MEILRRRCGLLFVLTAAFALATGPPAGTHAAAQQPTRPPPRSPRDAAPIDLTGNWVSVVTEDWRWRMVTPPKGDYSSVPLNDEGRKVADTWDLAKDEASGNQCRAYGAAAIMRVPGRVRISWENDNTLRIETDAGTQTRLLQFRESQRPTSEPANRRGRDSPSPCGRDGHQQEGQGEAKAVP